MHKDTPDTFWERMELLGHDRPGKRCWQCDNQLDLSGLNSKQKKAAHVCTDCVRKSMTKEELDGLLNPNDDH